MAWIAKTDPRLHRAYLLKEGLRHVFAVKGEPGKEAPDRWLSWAARCRIPAFVALGQKIRKHRAPIEAALEHDLSNALPSAGAASGRARGVGSPGESAALAVGEGG